MSELTAGETVLSELELLRRENAALRQQLGLVADEASAQFAVTAELPLEDRSGLARSRLTTSNSLPISAADALWRLRRPDSKNFSQLIFRAYDKNFPFG